MSSKIFALDIREQGLCAALIRTGLKEHRVENYTHVATEDAPDPADSLNWAVEKITERIDTSGATCLVSLPASDISFRNIAVPFKNHKKIHQILPFELEPSLAFEIDQLALDFITVRQTEQTDLIAAAVKKDKLAHVHEVLAERGISPSLVTAGGITQALCVSRLGSPKVTDFLFLDIDRFSATACIVVSGRIYLAGTFRKKENQDPDLSAREISTGMQRMMSAFETIYDIDPKPEKLIISGMYCPNQAFVRALGRELEMECTCVQLETETSLNFSIPEDISGLQGLNGALGLAGIEIAGLPVFNFSRRFSAIEKYWSENRTQLITTAVLAVFVFFLFISQAALEKHFLEKKVSGIDKQITSVFKSTFPEVKQIVDPVHQMRSRLKQAKGKNEISEEPGSDILNIDILRDISRLIPGEANVEINRFVRGEGSILLSGHTDTFNAVDNIKMQLQESQYFSGITISSATMDKAAGRIRFRIRADLADRRK